MNKIDEFFEVLKTNQSLREKLNKIEEGDWNEVVNVAKSTGFDFDTKELIEAIPVGFFQGYGQDPSTGWPSSTVPEDLSHKFTK